MANNDETLTNTMTNTYVVIFCRFQFLVEVIIPDIRISSSLIWNDNLQSFNGEKMKHRYQSFTRIGRQFQSLERQVYADWTSVSFPFCQRSCLIWRIMTNTLTNTMTNTYAVIFLSVSIFGRDYHSRYQNFEFTDRDH